MIKDIIEKVYCDGMVRGAKSVANPNYEHVCEPLSLIYQELKRCVPAKEAEYKDCGTQYCLGFDTGKNQTIDTVHKNLKNVCGE